MKKALLICSAVLVVGLLSLRLALPFLTQQAIVYGIESATPYKAEVGEVSYDLYNGQGSISDLTLRLKDVAQLSIKSFSFDLALQSLLDGVVALQNVKLAGLSTKALMDKERLEVAGYDLNEPSGGEEQNKAAAQGEQVDAKDSKVADSTQAEEGDGTLPVTIDEVRIEGTTVDFVGENSKAAKIVIDLLRVSAIDLRQKSKPAAVELKLKIDQSSIGVVGDVYPLDLSQTSALKLTMAKVDIAKLTALVASKMPKGLAAAGLVSSDLSTSFSLKEASNATSSSKESEPTINLKAKGQLGLDRFTFDQPGLSAQLASLQLGLDNAVTLKGDKYNVTGPAKLTISELALTQTPQPESPAGSKPEPKPEPKPAKTPKKNQKKKPQEKPEQKPQPLRLAIAKVAIAQKLKVETDSVKADGTIKLSSVNYAQVPTAADVAGVDLQTGVTLKGEALSGTVSGLISDIVTREEAGAKATGPQKKRSKDPVFKAKSLKLVAVALSSVEPLAVTAKRITLSDFVLAYPYKNPGIDYDPSVLDLANLKLNLDNYNASATAGQKGKVDFVTNIGKTGKITVNGTSVAKGVGKTTSKLGAVVDALDLTDFSGFFMQQMGYRIERGSLNADVKVAKNTKDDLDGNAKILLAKLQVKSKDRRGKTLKNRSSVPLESSLSMTKDDSDNLPLEFPITGNLNSPSFSPRILLTEKLSSILVDQLTQSLGTAIVSNYLPMLASSATLSPVLVYSLLKKGVDVATKLRFEPVTFGKASSIPSPKGAKVLRTVQKNLASKPNLILKFCTKAYAQEYAANTAVKPGAKGSKPTEEQIKKAFALAEKRLTVVRKTLRRSKKIKAKQIVTCKPTLDSEPLKGTELPELTISI